MNPPLPTPPGPRTWRSLAKQYQLLSIRALERCGAAQQVVERMHDEAGHPGHSTECELPWCRDLNAALSGD